VKADEHFLLADRAGSYDRQRLRQLDADELHPAPIPGFQPAAPLRKRG
jgi:hypothetical protein